MTHRDSLGGSTVTNEPSISGSDTRDAASNRPDAHVDSSPNVASTEQITESRINISSSTRTVTLSVDSSRHNYGRRATPCEKLFGIIPGRFHLAHESESLASLTDKNIVVEGLIPDGEAIKAGIKIGTLYFFTSYT